MTKKHKHQWFIKLDGIQFVQCDCRAIKIVEFKNPPKIPIDVQEIEILHKDGN